MTLAAWAALERLLLSVRDEPVKWEIVYVYSQVEAARLGSWGWEPFAVGAIEADANGRAVIWLRRRARGGKAD